MFYINQYIYTVFLQVRHFDRKFGYTRFKKSQPAYVLLDEETGEEIK